MARSISQTAREALLAPQTDKIFLLMLKLTSPELTEDLFFVQNNENIISNGDEYLATSFSSSIPVQEEGAVQDTTITISGINRQMIEVIRSVTESLDVEMFIIMSDNPDDIEAGPWDFKLRGISYDVNSVTGQLLFETALRNNVSTIRVTNQTFPESI